MSYKQNEFKKQVMLSPEWERLIKVAQRMQFGEATITFKHGKPIMMSNLIQRVKLDEDSVFRDGLNEIPII